MDDITLRLENIHKRFGGISALREVTLSVRAGTVHGLVGENGAGKSTLIKIAAGVIPPDSGRILIKNQEVFLRSPVHAMAQGIHVVHQEAELFGQLSVAENMLLGRGAELPRRAGGFIAWRKTFALASEYLTQMGSSLPVHVEAARLSVAQRTMAEIAAAVGTRPHVLFLDEPTASLSLRETEQLFVRIRELRSQGVAIVYVSHRLREILDLCDVVTILRDGEVVHEASADSLTMDRMVSHMVGRVVVYPPKPPRITGGGTRFRVTDLTTRDGRVQNVSFSVARGEILGLYGFVGAGRTEMAHALFGLSPRHAGDIEVDGVRIEVHSPTEALAAGIAYLPEDRLVQGIFRSHSVRSNLTVTLLRRIARVFWIPAKTEHRIAAEHVAALNVRTSSLEQAIGTLSGGNQQKVIFGRWDTVKPKVLLLDEPTRGVDVGAKAEIHALIQERAAQGAAVVLISSELPEIMHLSDRILTVCDGRITGEFDPTRDTEETIAAAAIPKKSETASRGASPAVEEKPRSWSLLLRQREVGLFAALLILALGMTVARGSAFANWRNFWDILATATFPAIVGQGVMFVICAGGIDISLGSMLGLTAALATAAAKGGLPPLFALTLGIGMGIFFGLCNGGAALLARIHPIIVTLAGISIYRGIMRQFTAGREITELPEGFRLLADGQWLGIPKICFYTLAITLLAHLLLNHTIIGRKILAVGNSENAARLIGLSKTRLTLFAFGWCGALTGLAAILMAAYYGKVQSNTGEGMELQAIAAGVIGGVNILGGRGSALGTLMGAFLVALLYNALILLNTSAYWKDIFVGGLILMAVVADALLSRWQRR